jgi:hypothetical protein
MTLIVCGGVGIAVSKKTSGTAICDALKEDIVNLA